MNTILTFRMNVFYCIQVLEYNFILIYNDTKKDKNDDLKKAKIIFKLMDKKYYKYTGQVQK